MEKAAKGGDYVILKPNISDAAIWNNGWNCGERLIAFPVKFFNESGTSQHARLFPDLYSTDDRGHHFKNLDVASVLNMKQVGFLNRVTYKAIFSGNSQNGLKANFLYFADLSNENNFLKQAFIDDDTGKKIIKYLGINFVSKDAKRWLKQGGLYVPQEINLFDDSFDDKDNIDRFREKAKKLGIEGKVSDLSLDELRTSTRALYPVENNYLGKANGIFIIGGVSDILMHSKRKFPYQLNDVLIGIKRLSSDFKDRERLEQLLKITLDDPEITKRSILNGVNEQHPEEFKRISEILIP